MMFQLADDTVLGALSLSIKCGVQMRHRYEHKVEVDVEVEVVVLAQHFEILYILLHKPFVLGFLFLYAY